MDDSSSIEAPVESLPALETRPCRRCRNLFDVQANICPHCGAVHTGRGLPAPQLAEEASISDRALMTVCIAYAIMLSANVLCGICTSHRAFATPEIRAFTLVFIESVIIAIVTVTWFKTRSLPNVFETTSYPFLSWLGSIPLLLLALATNIGYHQILIHVFGIPVLDDASEFESLIPSILLLCLQPAIAEELFFRGSAWKSLRNQMGPHATVLVTSAMFGMAHIGVPLSVPILFGLGLLLGYLRLWSGGLVLPMVIHFAHNLAIVLISDL